MKLNACKGDWMQAGCASGRESVHRVTTHGVTRDVCAYHSPYDVNEEHPVGWTAPTKTGVIGEMNTYIHKHTVYVVGWNETDARNSGLIFTDPDYAWEHARNTDYKNGEPPLRVYKTTVVIDSALTETEF